MTIVLPQPRQHKQSVGQKLSGGIGRGLSVLQEYENQAREAQALEKKQQSELANQMALQAQKYGFEKELAGLKGPSKEDRELADRGQTQETAQNAFNEMASLLRKGNLGRGSSFFGAFGGETAKDVGKFTSLGGALEALLVDKVNRGTLSNTRFEYITKNLLPVASDSDAEIEGKLEGLAEILDLDASVLTGKKNSRSYDLEELSPQSAKEHKGKLIEDDEGNRYRSNGKTWVRE